MKVKVLSPQKINQPNKVEPQILTPYYVKQLNEKNSYNVQKAENRREVGKKLIIRKSIF